MLVSDFFPEYAAQGSRRITARRINTGQSQPVLDTVIDEQPVALVYNGITHVVMLMTPESLPEFALGFSLSEGIVQGQHEVYDCDIQQGADGIELTLTVANRAFEQLKHQKRTMAGRSGCGLCGAESLQQLAWDMPVLVQSYPSAWLLQIPSVLSQLPQHQPLNQLTGGAHAAAWITPEGKLQAVFEDVGRHNALDKLLGHLSWQGQDFSQGFVLLTSRASYELVRKCARMGIRLLASISAPTTLAIELADKAGMGLVSFCRGEGMMVYGIEQAVPDVSL